MMWTRLANYCILVIHEAIVVGDDPVLLIKSAPTPWVDDRSESDGPELRHNM